ncbi:MAG: bifunctional (p)ppGpp synthetase/guanosine-3',5'-bis(diphosphate) 3'-pyrophosphohydrolase [Candidatus Sungbacteria bacterium]|nr:bifunctional (p)ppGpp synthetase/guanosine-3',5'-bis(diphosphate) 3'-pyrophosphohydrolase [Candidatus Sungbacteria bacterium]
MASINKSFSFLAAGENRETFFKRIEYFFPSLDPRYQMITRAYDTSKDAFHGKKREGGERYFEHLRAVALILIDYLRVRDYELLVAALLHDIVEDIMMWSVARVQREFGDRIALLIQWLSKSSALFDLNGEREHLYHRRFQFAPRDFFLIKLADRWHNLLTLHYCSKAKQRRKIVETKLYYLPYAERELILLHEIEAAIDSIEKTWSKKQ